MHPDFNEWTESFQSDVDEWRKSVKAALNDCAARSGTSAISRVMSLSGLEFSSGPLSGVPYGLKEAFELKGYPTTASSRAPCLTRSPAKKDSDVVKRLTELGASCVVKTQMNELAYGLSGENPHYGDCPHPTIPGALSGGSSSGSAHMVGAGFLPLGIGTDTGGSVRVPAAWCGIYGIRWVPGYMTEGMMPLASSFDTLGWFTQNGEDMAKVLRAWFSFDEAIDGFESIKLAGLRAEDYLEREAREGLGAVFDQLPLQDWSGAAEWEAILPDVRVAFNILQSTEAYENFSTMIEAHGVLLDPAVVGRIMRGRDWSEEQRIWADEVRDRVHSMFDAFFGEFDCLIMPICPGPAMPATHTSVKQREDTLNLTALASVAGLPAIAVPVFLDESRSVGLQFIFRGTEAEIPLKLIELWSSI